MKVIVTSAGDPLPWSKAPGAKKLAESIAIKNEIPEIVWVHVVPSVRAALRGRQSWCRCYCSVRP